MVEEISEQHGIFGSHPLKAPRESIEELSKPGPAYLVRRVVMLPLEQQPDDDRRQRARQAIGSEHSEDHRQAERGEQEFCRPFQKNDRRKHASDSERRNQGRNRDAGSAMKGRLGQRLAFFSEQTVGVLDRYG